MAAWFTRPTPSGGGCAFPYLDLAVWPNETAAATQCSSTLGELVRAREPRFAAASSVTLVVSCFLLFMHFAEVAYVYWTTCSCRGSRSAADSKKPLAMQLLRGLLCAVAGVIVAVDPGGLSGVVKPSALYMVGALLMACVVSFMCVYGQLLYQVATLLTRVAPLPPVTTPDASTPTTSAASTPSTSPADTPTARDGRRGDAHADVIVNDGSATASATRHSPAAASGMCNWLVGRLHAGLMLQGYVVWPDVVALGTLLPLRALSGYPDRYPSALAAYCGLLAIYFGMSVVLTLLPGWIVLRHLCATAALARNSSSAVTHVVTVAAVPTHADNGMESASAAAASAHGGGIPLVTDAAQLDGNSAAQPRRACGWGITSTLAAVRGWFAEPTTEAQRRRRALLWIGAVAMVGALAGVVGTAVMIRQTRFATLTGAVPEEFGGTLNGSTDNWQMYIFSNGLAGMWLGVSFQMLSVHRWRWCSALWQWACHRRSAACCRSRGSQYMYTGGKTAPLDDGNLPSGQLRCTVQDFADNRTITVDAATEHVDSHAQLP